MNINYGHGRKKNLRVCYLHLCIGLCLGGEFRNDITNFNNLITIRKLINNIILYVLNLMIKSEKLLKVMPKNQKMWKICEMW